MDIADFYQRLRAAGLLTSAFEVGSTQRVVIGLPWDSKDERVFVERMGQTVAVHGWETDEGDCRVADETHVWNWQQKWSFMNVLFHPDRVQSYRSSLQAMYELVMNYYFQEPVNINGWIIPVYQHPNWMLEKVTQAVLNARTETVVKRREAIYRAEVAISSRSRGPIIPDMAPEYHISQDLDHVLYYMVSDPDNERRSLHLRYDCEEAFIVEEPKTIAEMKAINIEWAAVRKRLRAEQESQE